MVKLPDMENDALAQRIYDFYKQSAEDWRRPHLGASVIGHHCSRYLWYSFRWAREKEFDGRMLRLFDTGHREEDRVAEDLRAIGMQLKTEDPETCEQWNFSWLGGHFGGSCDGLTTGVPGAPKSLHVFECKTANAKWFATIKKKGVRAAKPEHYSQMQVYMHGFRERGFNVSRAVYVVVCKDTDEIYHERVQYDATEAEAMLHKATLVVGSQVPLSRISEDPSWHQCNWCDYRDVCHFERVEVLERNCRTCLSSTATDDGTWFCEYHQERVDKYSQALGCNKHLFIPNLLPWEAVDADVKGRAVYYRDRNGVSVVDSACSLTVQGEGS